MTTKIQDIVFYIPYFQQNSNGISLLWEIAFKLSRLKEFNVHVFEKPWGPKTNLPEKYHSLVINQEIFSLLNDPIVVYPDIETKNPLNAEKVVRYLLAKPLSFGDPLLLNVKDYVVTYSELVIEKNILDQYYFLNNELDLLKYIDIEHKENLVSIYYGKSRIGENLKNFRQLLSRFDHVEIITRNEPREQKNLFEIISKSKLLITFDSFSHITLVANILGTPVIFIDPLFYETFQKFNQKFFGYYTQDDIGQINQITSLANMKNISRLTIKEIKKVKANEAKDLNRLSLSIKKHFKNLNNLQYLKANFTRLNRANNHFEDFFISEWSKRKFLSTSDRRQVVIYHLASNKVLFFLLQRFYLLLKPIFKRGAQKENNPKNETLRISKFKSRYNKFFLDFFWRL